MIRPTVSLTVRESAGWGAYGLTHLAGSSRLLRAMNEIAALSHLLDRGELTRADLRELTGLAKPTISEAVRRLTDAGLVVVVGHVSAGPGPNAEVYAANPRAAHVIAVSVRDTFMGHSPSLAAAVCDVSGKVLGRLDAPVDFQRTDPVEAVAGRLRTTPRSAGYPAGPPPMPSPPRRTRALVGGPASAGSPSAARSGCPRWSPCSTRRWWYSVGRSPRPGEYRSVTRYGPRWRPTRRWRRPSRSPRCPTIRYCSAASTRASPRYARSCSPPCAASLSRRGPWRYRTGRICWRSSTRSASRTPSSSVSPSARVPRSTSRSPTPAGSTGWSSPARGSA